MKLFAHPDCWEFKQRYPEAWRELGCGPGGIGDFFVPDKIVFLSVAEACRIHDWYYRFSWREDSENSRAEADRIFRNNMLRIINHHTRSRLIKWLRSRIALIYYRMVRDYGAPAWFEDRNDETEYKAV